MQCDRCWQIVDKGNRCDGCHRTIGEGCCGEVTWRWKGKDRICSDCIRNDDENRRVKLTARPARAVGGDKKMIRRPADQGRVMTLRKKHPTDGPGRDRGRPGREAPGKLWQPAALGRANQQEDLASPGGDAPSRAAQSGRDSPKTDAQCCTEGRWTCWHCGAVWNQGIAKHE